MVIIERSNIIGIIQAGLSPSPRRPSASPDGRLKVFNLDFEKISIQLPKTFFEGFNSNLWEEPKGKIFGTN